MTEAPYFKDIAPGAYLLLIDGPASREVAKVFRRECFTSHELYDPCAQDSTVYANPPDDRSCDEVREFLAAPLEIHGDLSCECGFWSPAGDDEARVIAERICAIAGGTEFLCDQVLPEAKDYCGHPLGEDEDYSDGATMWRFYCAGCRADHGLPNRLAILAENAPPLLVQRVRNWGGYVLTCYGNPGSCSIDIRTADGSPRKDGIADSCWRPTWVEVVRQVLEGMPR